MAEGGSPARAVAPARVDRSRDVGRATRYRRLLAYAGPHWRAIALVVAISVMVSAIAALQPWPLKLLVDYGLGGGSLPAAASGILAAAGLTSDRVSIAALAALASVLLFVASALLDAWLTIAWSRAGQRMVHELAGDLFLHLQRLSLIFHARRPVGDSLSRITGDAWTVYTLVDCLLLAPVKHAVVLLGVGVLAWQLDASLTLLLLLAMPALAASALCFGKPLTRADRARREALSALTAFVHQVLGALPAVQAFAAAGRNQRVLGALANEVVRADRAQALARDAYAVVNGVTITIGVALVVYAGGSRVLAGELSLGSLLVFIAYARSLEAASRGLLRAHGELRAADSGIDRALEILDSDERVVETADPRPLPSRRSAGAGHVQFEGVTFGYAPGRPVLREIRLAVQPGETVALVGATGAGKTTLASLLPRFFDPWSGCVLLDGVDIRLLTLARLRKELGLVLQDPFILPISVAENIAYGRPGASREEIIAAAVSANAHEFVRELPHGYETVIGEQGADLSGGQRQRIAIARALLKDPRVLVLDEPTSALDAGSESLVVQALSRLRRNRSTLIIAHRLSTVRSADRVVVLDAGQVAEQGTHDELWRRGGRYASYCSLGAPLREAKRAGR